MFWPSVNAVSFGWGHTLQFTEVPTGRLTLTLSEFLILDLTEIHSKLLTKVILQSETEEKETFTLNVCISYFKNIFILYTKCFLIIIFKNYYLK